MTVDKLKKIFGENNSKANLNTCGYFNDILKKTGFKSCESLAHYFSQVKIECVNLTKFDEELGFSYERTLAIFNYNKNIGIFFKQSFWDNKDYLDYFWNKAHEIIDTTNKTAIGTFSAEKFQKFTWLNKLAQNGDTVYFPIAYSSKNTPKIYNKVTTTETEKLARNKKLFSLIYANMNGNGSVASEDGYNFTGGGAIHITGRETYQSASNRCNELFGTNYDFINNAQLVKTDLKAAIYSSAGYMNWKLKRNIESLAGKSVREVTKIVNGGSNNLPERTSAFDFLNSTIYNCIK
jgi:predicted chitinase